MKSRIYYQWQRLTGKGKSVCISKPRGASARTAALAYAKRHGFTVAIWRTKAANLMVERTS